MTSVLNLEPAFPLCLVISAEDKRLEETSMGWGYLEANY
jgi:hypothetical protein